MVWKRMKGSWGMAMERRENPQGNTSFCKKKKGSNPAGTLPYISPIPRPQITVVWEWGYSSIVDKFVCELFTVT